LDYHELDRLGDRKFDYIISDFGGLNCTSNLAQALGSFSRLLNPGGKVTLMIMPRICPWELLMVLKGKFRTAFRRLKGKADARIEGEKFTCYYYSPAFVMKSLPGFRTITLRGICITVPPEFFSGFAEKYPVLFRLTKAIDRKISGIYPFNRWCDHFLITLTKTEVGE
jgi:hypothetical protein